MRHFIFRPLPSFFIKKMLPTSIETANVAKTGIFATIGDACASKLLNASTSICKTPNTATIQYVQNQNIRFTYRK